MFLRTWRFLTLTLIALGLAPAFSHALELRPKLQYDAELYLTLHRTLYEFYGKIGGIFEIGAVVAALVLAYLVRDRRPALPATLLGAAFMVAAHAAYWIWVAPMNALMLSWPVDGPPADWMRARDQWEYTHLARFFLQLFALAAIEVSILRETPAVSTAVPASAEAEPLAGSRRRAA